MPDHFLSSEYIVVNRKITIFIFIGLISSRIRYINLYGFKIKEFFQWVTPTLWRFIVHDIMDYMSYGL